MPGTSSSEPPVPPSFIRFGRFAPADAMPYPLRATSSFTFAPNVWTSPSNWLCRSWTASGMWFSVADEVHGFRYFDDRDVMGFVDGTENPRGEAAREAAIVGSEDPSFVGGSFVIVQKYLHDMKAWNALPVEMQERIIGRRKLSDVELSNADKPAYAHNALANIEENGRQLQILRDNMPFGRPGHGEFGTYFIGYSRAPRITEIMLENMFVGRPPGNYDKLLDFSHPVTGSLFFVPSGTFLDNVTADAPVAAEGGEAPSIQPRSPEFLPAPVAERDTSLRIGSLKGEKDE